MLEKLIKKHTKVFKNIPYTFTQPIKLDMMGEWIDYSGGGCISSLLKLNAYATINKREDNIVKMYYHKERHVFQMELDYMYNFNNWTTLLKNVLEEFINLGYKLSGFEGFIMYDVPVESGLERYLSLTLLLAKIVIKVNELDIDNDLLIKIVSSARNKFKKYDSSSYHEVALLNNKPGYIMYTDTKTFECKYTKSNLEDFSLVVFYDKSVSQSKDELYDIRKSEALNAFSMLESNKTYLSEVTENMLNDDKNEIRDKDFRRVRHVINANNRVEDMYKAMSIGDLIKCGVFMMMSQKSLYYDYEVSNKKQDDICTLAYKYNALGAKMVVSDYNNAVIALVKDIQIKNLVKEVKREYKKYYGKKLKHIITNIL